MDFFYDLNKKLAKVNATETKQTITESANVYEKWDTETKVNPAEKGKYAGKSMADLRKSYSKLKASGPHKKGSDAYGKMKELAFAIRAKSDWGKVDEADIDENAFNQAAAAAARAGKKEFEFGGKTHKVTMSKDTAHKLDDDVQIEEAYQYDMTDQGDMHDALGDVLTSLQKAAGITQKVYDAIEDKIYANESEVNEGRMKDSVIHDSETMSKEEFAKKHGKELADEMFDESINEAEGTIIFNAEEGGIRVSVNGKPVGWADSPEELAKKLGSMGVDKNTTMFHSSDVDFASEEGFDSDDGAHDMIDAALKMIGLSESSCKRMNEESDAEEDDKAEKAAKKVAKDIEHDEGHKGDDDEKAEKAGDEVKKDIEYDDEEDRKEKADESTVAGSVSTAPAAKKGGMKFGGSVYEAYEEQLSAQLNEGMDINVNINSDGKKTVSVTATDDDANSLAQLLNLAGVEPKEPHHHDAHHVDENAPENAPNPDVLKGADEEQYAGGLNKPKTTGQTTTPVIASQLNREIAYEDVDLERTLFDLFQEVKAE